MIFVSLPRVFPTMEMWGAAIAKHTFVISKDGDAPFLASVKREGAEPFDGGRTNLGTFETLDAAKEACMRWLQSQGRPT